MGWSILSASQGLYEPKRKVIWKNGDAGAQSVLQRFGARKKIANSLADHFDHFGQDAEFPEPLGMVYFYLGGRGKEIEGVREREREIDR